MAALPGFMRSGTRPGVYRSTSITSIVPPATLILVGLFSATLNAAGSTFVQPFFTKAFYTYTGLNQGLQVNYSGVGSGNGISDFQAGGDRVNQRAAIFFGA